jgi:serine/threonine protein kinase
LKILQSPYLLVISLCENGALQTLLRRDVNGHGKVQVLTVGHKLMMCRQTASGMAYLASRRLIHRDLATRNVLLDSTHTCKVADFGMARALQQEEQAGEQPITYYRCRGGMLPIRWTAPETLATMVYTQASDVWAFGVVVLEIFSAATLPYSDITNISELRDKLEQGWRAPRPTDCPPNVYSMLLRAWDSEPHNRCSFEELEEFFFSQPCSDLRTLRAAKPNRSRRSSLLSSTPRVESDGSGAQAPPQAVSSPITYDMMTGIRRQSEGSTLYNPFPYSPMQHLSVMSLTTASTVLDESLASESGSACARLLTVNQDALDSLGSGDCGIAMAENHFAHTSSLRHHTQL